MKRIVCLLLLTIIFVLGCGSVSKPSNTSDHSNSKGLQKVRIGTYQMDSGNLSTVYLYNDGIAGYLRLIGQSSLFTYNYAVKNKRVILTEENSNDMFMVFDITEDGNLKTGEDIYHYQGMDGIGNGNFNDRDPSDLMQGEDANSKPENPEME